MTMGDDKAVLQDHASGHTNSGDSSTKAMEFQPSQQTLFYVGWRSFHHRGYLVAYDRDADVVGVTKYQTFSEADTDEEFESETWESVNWVWKGPSAAFKEIAKGQLDPRMTTRSIQKEDTDAKWLLKLMEVFIQWYDDGKPEWEKLDEKHEFNSICSNFGNSGLAAISTFERDTAMRDADRLAASRFIESLKVFV